MNFSNQIFLTDQRILFSAHIAIEKKKSLTLLLSHISNGNGAAATFFVCLKHEIPQKYTIICTKVNSCEIIICLNVLSFYSCFIYVYSL